MHFPWLKIHGISCLAPGFQPALVSLKLMISVFIRMGKASTANPSIAEEIFKIFFMLKYWN